jgi:tol-pal system protein YbgF
MIIKRFFLIICFMCLLPLRVFAEAPVVDDSENYALLDEQASAYDKPTFKGHQNDYGSDEETALANDSVEMNSPSNTDSAGLLNKIQGLQQDLQELRGQLEVQAHDLKLLQQQQLAFYKDLDARVRHEPAHVTKNNASDVTIGSPAIKNSMATKSASPSSTQPIIAPITSSKSNKNPADEQISYLAAYELVKNKRLDEGLMAMQTFVAQHPQSGYTPNAQYWIGEIYMVKKNYPDAIQHFEIVLQQYPSSSKAAASLLKIGYALAESGRKQEAIERLQQVVKKYPDTNTAQLAQTKLDTLTS